MHDAAKSGDIKEIKRLLKSPHNINSLEGPDKKTPLMFAAENGQTDTAKCLVSEGADIEATSKSMFYCKTALMYAAENSHTATAKYLVSEGANMEAKDNNGATALLLAAEKGEIDTIEYLVSAGADIEAKNEYGKTALMLAVNRSYKKDIKDKNYIVKYLVSKGANIEATDKYGITSLMHAAQNGKIDTVKYLVSEGADIEAKNKHGKTALMYASEDGKHNYYVVNRKNKEEIVKYLVSKGADVLAKDNDGKTALMYPFVYNNIAIVECVVNAGADILAKDKNGKTALMWNDNNSLDVLQFLKRLATEKLISAAETGELEIIKSALEAGADIEAKDNDGKTALIWAALNGHESMAKHLLSSGADVNAVDTDRKTALIWAALNGHHSMTRLLVRSIADIDAKDNDGKTALIYASANGQNNIVRCLKELSDSVDIKDNDGKTALMYAIENGCTDIAKYLVDEGAADITEKDNNGSTALMSAEKNSHTETHKYLEGVAESNKLKEHLSTEKVVMMNEVELNLFVNKISNLSNSMATKDQLSAVGGIDTIIISWYQSSYIFIQPVSELKDYYEAATSTLIASFSSLQIQNAGIAWSDNAGNMEYFGDFLKMVAREIPIASTVVSGVTEIAKAARNYSQKQYARNIWTHIGKEINMPLYANMLACGMTLIFQESLKHGRLDKKNKLSDTAMQYCQSAFDEARGKVAQASVLSKFADSSQASDGVSDALGLIKLMMCIESREGAQKDRLLQLFNIAKQVRDERKSDSDIYVLDPFDISLGAVSLEASVSVNQINVNTEAEEDDADTVEELVSAEQFASRKELEALREEGAKSKAELAALKAKMSEQDGFSRAKNTQTIRQNNMIALGAHGGEVSVASNSANFFAPESISKTEFQELRAQTTLLTDTVACLEENQIEHTSPPKAEKDKTPKRNSCILS